MIIAKVLNNLVALKQSIGSGKGRGWKGKNELNYTKLDMKLVGEYSTS